MGQTFSFPRNKEDANFVKCTVLFTSSNTSPGPSNKASHSQVASETGKLQNIFLKGMIHCFLTIFRILHHFQNLASNENLFSRDTSFQLSVGMLVFFTLVFAP